MLIEEREHAKVGIYARVSTEEQANEGYSIRAQIEKLKSYALLKDWEIYDIYADERTTYGLIPKKPTNGMIPPFAGFYI